MIPPLVQHFEAGQSNYPINAPTERTAHQPISLFERPRKQRVLPSLRKTSPGYGEQHTIRQSKVWVYGTMQTYLVCLRFPKKFVSNFEVACSLLTLLTNPSADGVVLLHLCNGARKRSPVLSCHGRIRCHQWSK